MFAIYDTISGKLYKQSDQNFDDYNKHLKKIPEFIFKDGDTFSMDTMNEKHLNCYLKQKKIFICISGNTSYDQLKKLESQISNKNIQKVLDEFANILTCQSGITDVKIIMAENVQKQYENLDIAVDIDTKTELLEGHSVEFARISRRTKKRGRIIILMFIFVFFVVLITTGIVLSVVIFYMSKNG